MSLFYGLIALTIHVKYCKGVQRILDINYLDIGKRIRAERIKKDVTQEKLAELVGVGTTHISHIETGNTIPSLKIFVAIVNALKVSADELLCDSVEKSHQVYKNEISELTVDCNEKELRVITEMLKEMKYLLRKNYK